ncbi:DUF6069 family protein [Kineosporia sp. NBRC 101731]|uniref:DUF6069 family protein n=1 Tax=Kineosporia sp. NBRC 101731 TaxID=3032199 RepID=UPI0024A03D5F|nr:DUF6069 family protein [Kineosporia sp. NBRC 101731]GLY32285.1 hypothetical protein Kisp02_56500 [Kineosporia sp. NBRC 101731]
MTVTTNDAPTTRALILTGVVAAVVAAAATTAVAAVGHAAGISLDVSGEPIPVAGFASLTLAFSLIGLALAVGIRRFTAHPRTVFVRTTVALTVLSFVPDVFADAEVATRLLLMVTHTVAASIVIPAISRQLPD